MKRAVLIVAVGATVLGLGPASAQDIKMKALARGPAAVASERPASKPRARMRLAALVRYAGTTDWSLDEAEVVQEFFATRFDRPLPVSAWGQTTVHDHLGLDHRNALDVAVHPDGREGRALMAFLRSSGIPFVAVRSRVPGSSTGAHIHVGQASERIEPAWRAAIVARMKAERNVPVSDSTRPAVATDEPAADGSRGTDHFADFADKPPSTPPL